MRNEVVRTDFGSSAEHRSPVARKAALEKNERLDLGMFDEASRSKSISTQIYLTI